MRSVRAVGAAILLLALVAGVPLLLAGTIGNPATGVQALLAGQVTSQAAIAVLASIAWLAWAQFAVATLVELVSGLRLTPVPRQIPGVFAGQQQLARALVTAALLLAPTLVSATGPLVQAASATPVVAPATLVAQQSTPATAAPTAAAAVPVAATTTITLDAQGPRTWWDLAQTHLGAGDRWRELWSLNEGHPQPGGVTLTDPGNLRAGWTILLPAPTTAPSTEASPQTTAPSVGGAGVDVVVEPGDSLAEIATDHDMTWPQVWDANAGREQPDGERFTDPDNILPGWTVTIPAPPGWTASDIPDTAGTVTVQPRDTLSQIAVDHGSDVTALWAANTGRPQPGGRVLSDPDELQPGWTLTIPTTTPTAPDPAVVVATPDPLQAAPVPPGAGAVTPDPVAVTPDHVVLTPDPAVVIPDPAAAATSLAAPHTATTVPEPAITPPTVTDQASGSVETAATVPAPAAAVVGGEVSDTVQDSAGSGWQVPVFAAAGGGVLLAALAAAALARGRRRQFRHRRPGRAISCTPGDLAGMERTLLTTGRRGAADVTRLDQALRALVHTLSADPRGRLPEVIAARLAGDELELVLARVAQDAPAPWSVDSSGLRWTLRKDARVDYDPADRDRHIAPYPALVSVGYTSGDHWLLDLEMIGSLSLTGDPDRCLNLARFLAAELAHNSWSEQLQVTLVGFGEEMALLHPERLSYAADLDAAVTGLRIQLDTVQEVTAAAGVFVPEGRLRNIAGDTWAPQVLLVAPAATGDRNELDTALTTLRAAAGRVAVAIVLTGQHGDQEAGIHDGARASTCWQLSVDETGMLTVPPLDLKLVAEQLPESEAGQLAQLLALAAGTDDRPMPDAVGDRPWDDVADRTGGLRTTITTRPGPPRPPVRLAGTHPAGRDGSVLPLPVADYLNAAAVTEDDLDTLAPELNEPVRRRVLDADRTLDEDLADWWNEASRTPKVSVLGPVDVHAQGSLDPQRPRRAWNVEVVTYLTVHPAGVSAERFGMDLWPGEDRAHEKSKLRNAVYSARRWLGPNPRTGRDHLPANPGVSGGVYRVQDVLLDAELFRRLRLRAAARGPEGIADLQAALDLVTGVPFDGLRPGGYGWLAGDALDHDAVAMIVDVAHLLATHHLAAGEPERAIAAAQVALKAGSSADDALLDAAGGCFALGNRAEGGSYIRRIMANHDADVEEELPSRTYEILLRRGWLAS
jgi:LysM repeat protein